MTVDISNIKKGDKVTLLPATVEGVINGEVDILHYDGWRQIVSMDKIVEHRPAAPKALYVQGWVAWKDAVGLRIYASKDCFEEYQGKDPDQ
jgi:hypothetical protein